MFRKAARNPEVGSNPGYILPPDNGIQETDENSPKARKPRKQHPIRSGILITSLCFLAFIFIAGWVGDLIEPCNGDFARPASELIFELPVGLLVYWYFRKKRPTESIRNLPKRSTLLIAAAFALIVCFPNQMFYYTFHETIQPSATSSVDSEVPIVLVLELLVFAPILEEIVYRGALFGISRRFMGFWPSAILNAAIFAFMHFGNPLNMAMTVYLALTSAALYEKTGYLRYGMILHALFNWSGPILVMTGIELPPPATAVLFVLSVALFVIGVVKKDKLLDHLAA